MNTNTIYLSIVVIFMVALMIIGLIISRGIKIQKIGWSPVSRWESFLWLVLILRPLVRPPSSAIWDISLNGWPGWWNCAGTFVTSLLACLWFAKRLRRAGCDTLSDYIDYRFGRSLSIPAAILIVICTTALLAAQVIGGVVILQAFVNWNKVICCIILLVVFIAFTAMGGMKAVAWTDTVCSFVIIIGVWVMAITFLREEGGFTAMNEQIATVNPKFVHAER